MHDSMMIADVGGIVKVSGSRIATPLAPPRPGRTPMMTPNRMPTIIRTRLYQDNATWKPPISEAISSTATPQPCRSFPRARRIGTNPAAVERPSCAHLVYDVPIVRSVQYASSAHATRARRQCCTRDSGLALEAGAKAHDATNFLLPRSWRMVYQKPRAVRGKPAHRGVWWRIRI